MRLGGGLAVALAACSGGGGGFPTVSVSIGSNGGSALTTDGSGVNVPEAALTSDVTITVEPAPDAPRPPGTLVGTPICLGPEGQTFATAVEVVLAIDAGLLGKMCVNDVVIFTAPRGSSAFEPLVAAGSADETQVSTLVDHFSCFWPMIPDAAILPFDFSPRSMELKHPTFFGGSYYAVEYNGTYDLLVRSADAITWNPIDFIDFPTYNLIGSLGAGPEMLAVATLAGAPSTGTVYTSADGTSWVDESVANMEGHGFDEVVWNGSQWLVKQFDSIDGAYVWTSPDATTWTGPMRSPDLLSVAWVGDQYIGVGSGGFVGTSADGTTWTLLPGLQELGVADTINRIAWNGSALLVVGGTGFERKSVYRSVDKGRSWSRVSLASTYGGYQDVAGCADEFVLVENFGTLFSATASRVLVSSDGVDWTPSSSLDGKGYEASCDGPLMLVTRVSGGVYFRAD